MLLLLIQWVLLRIYRRIFFKAFAATLEELHEADLLLHVADMSNSRVEDQIESVKKN